MAFDIETSVPPPENTRGVRGVDPNSRSTAIRRLIDSPAGASVFFPDHTVAKIANITKSATGHGFKKLGLTARTVEGGVRVWKL